MAMPVSYGRVVLADYLAGYEGRLMRSLKSLLDHGPGTMTIQSSPVRPEFGLS